MKKKTDRQVFWGTLSLLWVMYIYSHSANTAAQSQMQSNAVTALIIDITQRLFGFALQPEFIENIGRIVRKCAHMALFFVLAALLFVFIMSICKRKRPISTLAFTAAFAASDEFHQIFTPGRGPLLSDVAIDTFGAMLGILLLMLFFRKDSFLENPHRCLPEYSRHGGKKR